MGNRIWVYIDHFKGEVHPGSWEALGAARDLADDLESDVTAIVLGTGVEAVAQSAIQRGADEVVVTDDPLFEDFRSGPFADQIAHLVADADPIVILFPTTTRGRELAGMSAIDLNTGVITDATELSLDAETGTVRATKPVYAGKVLSTVVCDTRPQIISLRTRAFSSLEPDEARQGDVRTVEPAPSTRETPVEVTGYGETEGGVSLADASIVVSGGRGVANNPDLEPPPEITDEKEQEIWRAKQGFQMLFELAEVLNAAVGASRAAVDSDYIPYPHQVGQTGKVVSPDLYIACGISGAIQHLAGMRTSKNIVAINKDADAPIFKLARFGVTEDLWKVLPPLTETLRERLK